MKWNSQDVVAIILASIIAIAIFGVIAFSVGYDERISDKSIEWIGKLLLVIVGSLTMFMGSKHNNNK